ncbi:MAG: hypothetical protein DMF56_24850 [Acidobacteria bacterium]|nr:MAG: hypothetical protein DMF56_24850 [Acidobacteriota bacterium]
MAAKKTSTKAAAPVPPYGAPINDAIKRGDRAEMRRLLTTAKKTLKDNANLAKAVAKLEAALNKG